jgi:hypothetical protein
MYRVDQLHAADEKTQRAMTVTAPTPDEALVR